MTPLRNPLWTVMSRQAEQVWHASRERPKRIPKTNTETNTENEISVSVSFQTRNIFRFRFRCGFKVPQNFVFVFGIVSKSQDISSLVSKFKFSKFLNFQYWIISRMVPTCLYFEQKIPEGQTIRQKLNIRTENEFRNEYRNEYRNFGIRFCFVSGPETYFGFGFIIVSLRQKSLVILLFRYSHYTEISLSHSFRYSTFRSFPTHNLKFHKPETFSSMVP